VARAWIAAWSGPGTLPALLAGEGAGTCVTREPVPVEAPDGR
jgi:hypothetical protein